MRTHIPKTVLVVATLVATLDGKQFTATHKPVMGNGFGVIVGKRDTGTIFFSDEGPEWHTAEVDHQPKLARIDEAVKRYGNRPDLAAARHRLIKYYGNRPSLRA